MKKNKQKSVLFLNICVVLCAMLGLMVTHFTPVNQVQAASVIPVKMRGSWKSKPTYTSETKHVNKNIAIPAIRMKVGKKTAKWSFVGYLPKGFNYNHQKHTLKLVKSAYADSTNATLKGHGPYRSLNYLMLTGKKLIMGYHGGSIIFRK